jgi:hypothetical protein
MDNSGPQKDNKPRRGIEGLLSMQKGLQKKEGAQKQRQMNKF